MADTKHKISSLAAPTPEDIAVLDAMHPDEKREMIIDALLAAEKSPSENWNADKSRELFERAQATAAAKLDANL